MQIRSKLLKMNLQQLREVSHKMSCGHHSRENIINCLMKPLLPNYSMESKSFSKFRTGYVNNLKQSEKHLQTLLKNKEKNLKKLMSGNTSKWFVDKNNKEIEDIQRKIMDIQDEIKNISEDKLLQLFSKQQNQLNLKEKEGKAKIMKKVAENKKKREAVAKDRKKMRLERKDDRDLKRHANQAYRHFKNVNIPDHLKEKLKKMPGNRGFVYKSVHYFGHLPDKKYESVILMERKPDGTLLTHEYTDTEYILHLKEKDKPQQIIERKKLLVPVPERKKKPFKGKKSFKKGKKPFKGKKPPKGKKPSKGKK